LEFYFRFRFWLYHRNRHVSTPNFIQIAPHTAEIWRHIDFSRWRPRRLNTSSGFVFIDVTAFRRSKSISKQISSTYLNSRLRYNYFPFWKTNVRHVGILLPVSISTFFAVICTLFCIKQPSFVYVRAPAAECGNMTSYSRFSRWLPRPLTTTSGFVSVDVTAFTRSKSTSKPNFVDISQFTVEI